MPDTITIPLSLLKQVQAVLSAGVAATCTVKGLCKAGAVGDEQFAVLEGINAVHCLNEGDLCEAADAVAEQLKGLRLG